MPEHWAAGGCACGAVRYTLAVRPYWTHCCHCTDCQRLTGSACAVNTMIETAHVSVSGPLRKTTLTTESGDPQIDVRCERCGTGLWTHYAGVRAISFVRAGTLDDPSLVTPDIHVFTRSKQPWVGIPGGVPTMEIFYEYEAVWPKEALARRAAALDVEKDDRTR